METKVINNLPKKKAKGLINWYILLNRKQETYENVNLVTLVETHVQSLLMTFDLESYADF